MRSKVSASCRFLDMCTLGVAYMLWLETGSKEVSDDGAGFPHFL
jgi:hypothetical protein